MTTTSTSGRRSMVASLFGQHEADSSVSAVELTRESVIVPARDTAAGIRVLVVDDDPAIVEAMEEMLEGLGATPVTATTMDAGRDMLRRGNFALAILDLHLNGGDSLALLDELRHTPRPWPCIAFASGLDEDVLGNAREAAQSCGFRVAGVLNKPVTEEGLAGVLDTACNLQAVPEDEQPAQRGEREMLEAAFATALREGRLVPWFQPQYRLRTRQLVGFEALARIVADKDSGRVLTPASFFRWLEDERFHWDALKVIASPALDTLATLWSQGRRVRMSLNIPVRLFAEKRLPDMLWRECERRGLPSEAVVLELTERGAPELSSSERVGLTRARIAGFRLSLDDFGVGNASVERLARLPLNEVKLDGWFIDSAASGGSQENSLAWDVAQLCRNRGITTVAERIEEPCAAWLGYELGFDVGQGFLLGRPASPDDAIKASAWLDRDVFEDGQNA